MIDLEGQPDFVFLASRAFLWRVVLIVLAVLLVVFAKRILLTIFLGILLATILRVAADWVQHAMHVSSRWAYVLVLIAAVGAVAALGYSLGPRVVAQAHQIARAVPKSVGTLEEQLERYQWGRDVTRVLEHFTQPEQTAGRVKVYATNLVAGITTIIVILAIALFLGANPGSYRNGALRLLPEESQAKASDLLHDLAFTMKWWVIGQLAPMAILGIGSMLGLWLMGIPLAFTLGLLTAAMLFVPYVGSVIAYLPAALIALTMGPGKVLYVTILYLGVHLAEGYIITPLVQRRAVKLPPALTLSAQLFFWKFAGLLGLLAATPLTAVGLVLVQKLYLNERQNANP